MGWIGIRPTATPLLEIWMLGATVAHDRPEMLYAWRGPSLLLVDREGRSGTREYKARIAASLVAETAFVAVVMGRMAAREKDPWKPTRASASLVFGPEAAESMKKSPKEKAMEAVMHAFYGLVFGLAYQKITNWRSGR